MISRGRNLYIFLFSASVAGYVWLLANLYWFRSAGENAETFCLFKRVTHLPCPSCGSTRAIEAMLQGHISESLHLNPLGSLILLIMLILPVWVMIDVLLKKSTLQNIYRRAENWLRKPAIGIPASALILLNWIWNIVKGM